MKRDNRIYATEDFHIGKRIKAVLASRKQSITWLAQEVNCSRENLYKTLRRPEISTEMLFRISWVLGHDFFKEFSKFLESEKHKKCPPKAENGKNGPKKGKKSEKLENNGQS